MTAAPTLHEVSPALKFPEDAQLLAPRHGVLTLVGFGIKIYVERGHLVVEDGIASDRAHARFARVGHGLRRLVVIGSDGFVSLGALRWLSDQQTSFLMINRNGKVLVACGPIGPKDARLRRAQAVAHHTGVAVPIARDLIDRKLVGQERLIRERFAQPDVAQTIAEARDGVRTAETLDVIRTWEARAAAAYWALWQPLVVRFPQKDLARVPEHWRAFGLRSSLLTGSPRLAVTPPNAMLNFLYALAETEVRLAAVATGLDPSFGVLHMDAPARDSLVFDLLEPIRPLIDRHVLDWITQTPLQRAWFFEERNGNCRLMAPFAVRLSETMSTWARAVAPIAEHVANVLWATTTRAARRADPATRLTQRHRREAHGHALPPDPSPPRPPRLCHTCGTPLRAGLRLCARCQTVEATRQLVRVAAQGRLVAQRPEAQARRAASRRQHAAAERAWKSSDQPAWLTEEVYTTQIQPRLAAIKLSTLCAALGLAQTHAINIRAGRYRPHPRHWLALARLAGVSGGL